MIHTTIGIYANGDYKVNGVDSEFIAGHIAYNIQARPGRALIVDGHCVSRGYLTFDEVRAFLAAHPNIKASKDTQPYR